MNLSILRMLITAACLFFAASGCADPGGEQPGGAGKRESNIPYIKAYNKAKSTVDNINKSRTGDLYR